MKTRNLNALSIIFGIFTVSVLVFLFLTRPGQNPEPVHWLLFVILLSFTTLFGIPLAIGEISLVPMVSFAAMLVMGPIPAAFAELVADIFLGLARWQFPQRTGWQRGEGGFSLLATTTANLTMHIVSIIAAGGIFYSFGGQIPIRTLQDLLIVLAAGAMYIAANYLLAAFFLYLRSIAHVEYLWKHLRQMLLYEIIPMVFAPLAAHILLELGVISFIVFSLSLMISAGIMRDQAKARNSLERRVQELASLQAVGQSLSTSLDIEDILEGIYREVSKLMAADNFYVALYNPETNEVSFPLVYEHNQKANWPTREAGKGLTEYVLETKEPLLIEKNVKDTVESLGMVHYGQEAISWLGVPILSGDQPLGMIAVQSYPLANQIQQPLDDYHKQVLSTISAQASVAIQNARLYAQTDQALSQRVLELDSILTTISEGLALLDKEMTIVEINRALCQMLDCTPSNLIGRSVQEEATTPHKALMIQNAISSKLINAMASTHQDRIALPGDPEIPVERTISPVREENGEISGWLLVFRDLTEEYRLTNFREDLTRMLVHDLRSPIVTIQGGLDMISVLLDDEDYETIPEMVRIAQKGCLKMLGMINELLNINQLEAGELTLQYRPVDIAATLRELNAQFSSVLKMSDLDLSLNLSRDLPLIHGDPDLLKRVFHNLLDNAIKYTPDDNQLVVWAKRDQDKPGNILVAIKDSGPGIPEKMQRELFKKNVTFQQEKSRRRGTGLGLYFCSLAVEAHSGEIWVESKLGEGSTFFVRLPVVEE